MSDGPLESSIREALSVIKDPETGRSITKTNQVLGVSATEAGAQITVGLTTFAAPLWEEMGKRIEDHLKAAIEGLNKVSVKIEEFDRPPQPLGEIGLRAKSVIAVGSGKGGVGKSTIAASIALGLQDSGCKVGLMDADVFGPSIPHLLGLGDSEPTRGPQKMVPVFKGEMPVMSMGFMIKPDQAVIWRGPMLHSAVTQMLRDFEWGQLDYLIIDMPPGTGDVPLSLSQVLQPTGAVVVCTPQQVALLDAVKAMSMFRTVNIPILGMVENMSGFVCPDCNKRYDIFGSGGAEQTAREASVPFLGDVPIHIQIREHGDAGTTDANFSDPNCATYLKKICYRLVRGLADKAEQEPPRPQLPVLG